MILITKKVIHGEGTVALIQSVLIRYKCTAPMFFLISVVGLLSLCGCILEPVMKDSASDILSIQISEDIPISDDMFMQQIGAVKPETSGGRFVYKTSGGIELAMFLSQPHKILYEYSPLIVNVIGPGWTHSEVRMPFSYMANYVGAISTDGFASLTVSYRGMENGQSMSELIGDVVDALGYISRYNDLFKIDMDRLIAAGSSAGAHVALMLALAPHTLLTADCAYQDFDFTVIGCMALVSPTMLYPDEETHRQLWNLSGLEPLFGGVSCYVDDSEYRKYSPITYVSADMVPVLLGVGGSDPIIDPKQSYLFNEAAEKVNGDCTMFVLKHAGHGFEAIDGEVTPPVSEFYMTAYDFVRGLVEE